MPRWREASCSNTAAAPDVAAAARRRCARAASAALRESVSLSDDEARLGWVLTCTHEARSDVTLDIEDLGALAGIAARVVPARVDRLELLAPDVMRIELRLPPRSAFRFLPGQSIDVTSPSGVRRSYSIASAASQADRVEIQVRRVDQGVMSGYWFEQARTNDLLRFNGPRGTFYLRPLAGLDLVFLATGTGIAPILSMLAQVAACGPDERPRSVTLYWGGRHPPDLYLAPGSALPGLRYVPVLSRGRCGLDRRARPRAGRPARRRRAPRRAAAGRLHRLRLRLGGHDPRRPRAPRRGRTAGEAFPLRRLRQLQLNLRETT